MGRLKKGILGSFKGTVGTVIGSTWNGIDYMKSQPGPRGNGNSSDAQLAQQAKFVLVGRFIKAFGDLFKTTFKNNAVLMTGTNNAFSYNVKNALTGSFPNSLAIDYALVMVSRGELLNCNAPTAAKSGTDIVFTWGNNAGLGRAKATDKSIVVVYCKEVSQVIYTIGGAVRSDATETLDCSLFTGKEVQTWLGFISNDGVEITNSVFTGQLSL